MLRNPGDLTDVWPCARTHGDEIEAGIRENEDDRPLTTDNQP
jgi:hypothetical protein